MLILVTTNINKANSGFQNAWKIYHGYSNILTRKHTIWWWPHCVNVIWEDCGEQITDYRVSNKYFYKDITNVTKLLIQGISWTHSFSFLKTSIWEQVEWFMEISIVFLLLHSLDFTIHQRSYHLFLCLPIFWFPWEDKISVVLLVHPEAFFAHGLSSLVCCLILSSLLTQSPWDTPKYTS